ncbi:hypothetical protein SN10121_19730 [Ligilactobacillus agilis]|nr:hypothetical protein SN10121_19730 [Ligilactobacillus agilis]
MVWLLAELAEVVAAYTREFELESASKLTHKAVMVLFFFICRSATPFICKTSLVTNNMQRSF